MTNPTEKASRALYGREFHGREPEPVKPPEGKRPEERLYSHEYHERIGQ